MEPAGRRPPAPTQGSVGSSLSGVAAVASTDLSAVGWYAAAGAAGRTLVLRYPWATLTCWPWPTWFAWCGWCGLCVPRLVGGIGHSHGAWRA